MKKFKKVMAIGLAVMAIVSAMSISAMAEDETMVDISACEAVIQEINTKYGENIVYTLQEDIDSISQSDLDAFRAKWEAYAKKQKSYKEKSALSESAKTIAPKDMNTFFALEPRAIYTLTHSIPGEYIDITATGSYAVSSVRFGSCSNVTAACTAPFYVYYGYTQNSYTANVIDAGRTLAVTSRGEQWGEDTFGTYYDDDFSVYTEFYYTEL